MQDLAFIEIRDNRANPPGFSMGESLDPILFIYGHWAVTTYGIEHISGTYAIEASRVFETDWQNHMAEKNWVDLRDFEAALFKARKIFDKSGKLATGYKNAPTWTLLEIASRAG